MLDQTRLVMLRSQFNSEETAGILDDIETTITTELDEIKQAVTNADPTTLLAAAHRLKNAAGLIGATALADAAAALESQTKTDRQDYQPSDKTTIRTLTDHWSATQAAIAIERTVGPT